MDTFSRPVPPAKEEWDFSALREEPIERNLCVEYEYMRDSPAAQELLSLLQTLEFRIDEPIDSPVSCITAEFRLSADVTAPIEPWARPLHEFLCRVDFPQSPFLLIPEPLRNELVQRTHFHENLLDVGSSVRDWVLQGKTMRNRRQKSNSKWHYEFNIDWTLNNDELTRRFLNWLIATRPPEYPDRKDRGGRRKTVQDALNQLGAYRFASRKCDLNAARKQGFTQFSSDRTWKSAVMSAQARLMNEFEQPIRSFIRLLKLRIQSAQSSCFPKREPNMT